MIRARHLHGLALSTAAAILLLAGCHASSAPAAGDAASREIQSAVQHPAAGEPAPDFNFYILALSWSPEYCHGHPNSRQCGGDHPGFVVHGLWPQRNSGQWPSNCSNAPGLPDPQTMLDLMPSPRLIAHEWATHGTCSGLTPADYFALVRKAYRSIRIPAELTAPAHTRTVSAGDLQQMFAQANPGMTPQAVAITCHNRYLSGVEICLSKSLQPMACRAVRSCNARTLRIPAAH